ncbi:MAG: peptidase M14 [Acidobacteria bacterium]|nr:peptidase M14 [Acidobacteriota bacterium]
MKKINLGAPTILLGLIILGGVAGLSLQATAPSPEEFLGFRIGDDRKLADWSQILAYYQLLSKHSDRIQLTELGKTTEGRPFILITISAPENLRQLDRYRAIQKALADPRKLSPQQADALIQEGKAILLLTCNIHSTEVAGAQTSLQFSYRLATDHSERTEETLRNVIILLVPSLNPDGQDKVAHWYRQHVGTAYEGGPYPFLYHKYVGHDNNRDWYMFTQVETRLAVEKIHNAWHPHVVHDVHQMGARSARMFLPPWVDPIDPNIDPILVQEMNFLGSSMALDLIAEGKKGILTNALFDLWSPSRHYQCYHGGLRILTESASARLASPITVPFDKLENGRGYSAKTRSWNFPDPWLGGEWRLRDIVNYQLSAFSSIVSNMARYRERFVRTFFTVLKKAATRSEPSPAFVIPPDQKDPVAAAKMLNTLRFGLVEVHRAKAGFAVGVHSFPAGSYVIDTAQPFGAFAKTLMESQKYPDRRAYPGGPPEQPYDATAHTLPLLMGVNVATINQPFTASLELVETIAPPAGQVLADAAAAGYVFSPETNQSFIAVQRLLGQGGRVYRLARSIRWRDLTLPAGAFYVPHSDLTEPVVRTLARDLSLAIYGLATPPKGPAYALRPVRLGIYKSFVPSMDEGWTRYVLEQLEIPYESLYNKDIRAGRLHTRFDAILIPDSPPATIINGYGARQPHREELGPVPPKFAAGIGEEGLRQLQSFMEAGGHLVALNNASNLLIEKFNLPVQNVLKDQSEQNFYCPGSILRVEVDTTHPIAYGMDKESIAWFEHSPAMEAAAASIVVRYPGANPLLSGWLLGEKLLYGKGAVVDVPVGKGRAILFGFRVQYRAQSYSTYKLLCNALYISAAKKVTL